MAGAHQGSATPLAMGFDLLCSNWYEFHPMEQVLSPVRKQLVTPVSVIATTAPMGTPYLAGQYRSVHGLLLAKSSHDPSSQAACRASSNAWKLLSQFQLDFSVRLWCGEELVKVRRL